METKFIIGIVVALVLVGGVVGCNYVINNPTQPAVTDQASVAAENQQNTTNETTNVTKNETNPKVNATTKTVKQTCTKCGGKGYFKCSACGGDGCNYVDCTKCSGGKVTIQSMVKAACHEEDCAACGGSGKIKSICKSCGGDGKILCSACHGKGYNWITVTQ